MAADASTPMPHDDRLMTLHVEGLYSYDAHGRMSEINDGSGAPAPRFWLGRTPGAAMARFRSDLPPALVRALSERVEPDPSAPLSRLPERWSEILALLEEHAPVQRIWAGPVFVCPRPLPSREEAVSITAENRQLLQGGLDEWQVDVDQGRPMQAVVVAGRAVSVCASVRITEHAEEAGVETLPEHRRRGHGAAAVAAWASDAHARGVVPLYSTSWDNEASRMVARALGLRCFGVECHAR